MASIFSLTVVDNTKDTKAAEVQQVARALRIAETQVRSKGGAVTAGTITDDAGVVLGSWSFTGSASRTG